MCVMFNNGILQGDAIMKAAKDMFRYIKAIYPHAKDFFNYFEKTWMQKIDMWVKRYRSILHAN